MSLKNCVLGVFLIHAVNTIQSIDQKKFHKSDGNQVYYIENEYKYDWFEAWSACARMNMTLLSIENKDKSDEINALVKKTLGNNRILWVGGYAVGTARRFTWMATGDEFVYTYWYGANPDFYQSKELCAQIGWSADMRWNDNSCGAKFGYVCEYKRMQANVECKTDGSHQKFAPMAFNFYNHKN